MQQNQSRKIEKEETFLYEFSVCTLVTNGAEYEGMLRSFIASGFSQQRCEFMYIDNSARNTFEAYAGLNRFLREAKGKYVILCHQDILLKEDGFSQLQARIAEIEKSDPKWAALGNAGGLNIKHRGLHLFGAAGKQWQEASLPLKTQTLDENFIVVKKSSNLTLSSDLEGFHLYGADICLVADLLGYNCYVIDFKLIHKSEGKDDQRFYQLKSSFIRKYRRAYRPRFISTTITRFFISGSRLLNLLGNMEPVLFLARQYYKLFRTKEHYHLKIKP